MTNAHQPTLSVNGDYHQSAAALLCIKLAGNRTPVFQVAGNARLDGVLNVVIPDDFQLMRGKSCIVLTANQVVGAFANPRNEVVASDGSRFAIGYSKSAVTLTAR